MKTEKLFLYWKTSDEETSYEYVSRDKCNWYFYSKNRNEWQFYKGSYTCDEDIIKCDSYKLLMTVKNIDIKEFTKITNLRFEDYFAEFL